MMTGRTAILVLGMHRSGTSALTRVLGHLGCAMPNDGIEAHPDNPKGYWEPQALVRESDRVFRTAHTSWFDPRPLDLAATPEAARADYRSAFARAIRKSFGEAPLIAVKDPRLCRLVPLFVEAAADLGYETRVVLMNRAPGEIARSLHARDRSTAHYAHALWLRHMLDAERDSRDLPRATVSYDDLLADWRATIRPLLRLLPAVDPEGVAPAIDAHVDRRLRHHGDHAPATLDPRLAPIVADAERAFAALAFEDDGHTRGAIDDVAARFGAGNLLDDIIHDELRHRRVRELALAAEVKDCHAREPATEELPVTMPPLGRWKRWWT